jgi:tRNA(Arg) A34 adenosine deaminase TadA
MSTNDQKFIRLAIEIARRSRDHGNHPFGAILVDDKEQVLLEAENSVVTTGDITCHAELNLLREASAKFSGDFLAGCTLYASTEPCPMCSGGIFWANIGRLVYGLSAESLYQIIGSDSSEVLSISCREIYATGRKQIVVVGPLLEDEARQVHIGFWS